MLSRPIVFVWSLVAGGASIAAYLGLCSKCPTIQLVLGVICITLAMLLIGALASGYRIYRNSVNPIMVRAITEGEHYYHGRLILILDRSMWVRQEQILSLFTIHEDIQMPLCLLRVETFTSKGFPQREIIRVLTNEDINIYLSDKARWPSLFALPEIRANYLEG
jgi:hypothetical protein